MPEGTTLAPLGELTRHDRIEEWLVSAPIDVPLLGVRLAFVIEGLESDANPSDFAGAVTNFLALTREDREAATPHVFRNYRRFVEAVGDQVEVHIDSAEDVWRHVHPAEIYVSRRHRRDRKVYVQVAAECDWEIEHGLQLVYREGRQLSRVSEQDGHLTHTDACDLAEGEDLISE